MDLTHYSHKENEMKTDGGVMTNETKKVCGNVWRNGRSSSPLIIMMGTMIFMVAFGMRSTKNFWSAGYFAVLAGFLVYKDKKAFQKALIDGVRDNIFAFMIACFLFAGVMSKDSDSVASDRSTFICNDKDQHVAGTDADHLFLYLCGAFQCNRQCGGCVKYSRTSSDFRFPSEWAVMST
ncbi:MAG: hypothetical protein ACLR8P_06790 [Clostridium fessum]